MASREIVHSSLVVASLASAQLEHRATQSLADEMGDVLEDENYIEEKYAALENKYEAALRELEELKRDFQELNEKYVVLQIKHANLQDGEC